MYFVNMLEGNGMATFREKMSENVVRFYNNVENTAENVGVVLDTKRDKPTLVVSGNGENLFAKGLGIQNNEEYLSQYKTERGSNKYKSGVTNREVMDTAENPILIVLCNEIGIYDNIPVCLKYLYVDDNTMLVALISGVCDFNGVTLQRSNISTIGDKTAKPISASELRAVTSCIEKESGYCYIYDAVMEVILKYNKNKMAIQSKTVSEEMVMFSDENYKEFKRKAEERKRIHDELLRRKQEEREAKRKAEEDRIEKERQERLQEELEEASRGAAEFLKIIQGL